MDPTLRANYLAVLADLEAKRRALEVSISAIRSQLGAGVPSPEPSAISPDAENSGEEQEGLAAAAFDELPLGMAIREVLKDRRGKSATPVEIAEALESRGFRHSSRRLATTVSSAMARDARSAVPTFYSPVRGRWALLEWHPQLRQRLLRERAERALEVEGSSDPAPPPLEDFLSQPE